MLTFLLSAWLSGLLSFFLNDHDKRQKADNLAIYLVIGQSNMAGRAEVTPKISGEIPGVFLFTGNSDELWIPAKNPLNIYSSIRKEASMQRLSPAYSFAKAMRKKSKSRDLGLVVNARGGTAIAEWMPGTHYYKEIVKKAKEAAEYGRIRGVIWHQGESDLGDLSEYLANLEVLIVTLRKDLGLAELPFVAGHIAEDQPGGNVFNRLIDNLPEKVPFTGVASGRSTRTFDEVHFDTKSQLKLGKRYAKQMIRLLD